MEILAIERALVGIQQLERFASRRNDDVLTDLRRMGKNGGKAVEHALAELDNVAPRSGSCRETLDSGMAEIRGKDKCVTEVATAAIQEVIAPGARQRAGGSFSHPRPIPRPERNPLGQISTSMPTIFRYRAAKPTIGSVWSPGHTHNKSSGAV
jgi:hypothetical protein